MENKMEQCYFIFAIYLPSVYFYTILKITNNYVYKIQE